MKPLEYKNIKTYSFRMLEKEYNVIGMLGLASHQRPKFIKNNFYYHLDNVWYEFKNLEDKKLF